MIVSSLVSSDSGSLGGWRSEDFGGKVDGRAVGAGEVRGGARRGKERQEST